MIKYCKITLEYIFCKVYPSTIDISSWNHFIKTGLYKKIIWWMQVKCNRGYCQDVTKEKPKSIKDIEERVLKAVAVYNDALVEKVI